MNCLAVLHHNIADCLASHASDACFPLVLVFMGDWILVRCTCEIIDGTIRLTIVSGAFEGKTGKRRERLVLQASAFLRHALLNLA